VKKLFRLSLFIIAALSLSSCSSTQDVGNNSKRVKKNEVLNTSVEVSQGDFIYRIVTEKREYLKNEKVKIYAELEYIGDKDEVTIYHAASPFSFPMVEKTRDFQIDYFMNEPLISTTLINGKPLREEYKSSGGYGSEDEKKYIDFMKNFINKGFPSGYYVVNGSVNFYVENVENKKQDYNIKGQIEFKVKGDK
jgi:uncharacterized protein YcfL